MEAAPSQKDTKGHRGLQLVGNVSVNSNPLDAKWVNQQIHTVE